MAATRFAMAEPQHCEMVLTCRYARHYAFATWATRRKTSSSLLCTGNRLEFPLLGPPLHVHAIPNRKCQHVPCLFLPSSLRQIHEHAPHPVPSCPSVLSTSPPALLLLGALGGLLLLLLLLLVVVLEAAGGELVETQDGLVGVLDEDELAVLALEAHVGDGADDAPAVGQGEVHLVGEVAGLPADDAEDDVLVVGAGVDAGDETVRLG